MTELELFYRHVPDIAELACSLLGMTPDQRKEWKQKCLEYADSLNPCESEFIHKMLITQAWRQTVFMGAARNPGGPGPAW